MRKPTKQDKIDMYERFLHRLSLMVTSCSNEGVKQLVQNADRFSYAHRVGNGEYSDKEQQKIINAAFWKILD